MEKELVNPTLIPNAQSNNQINFIWNSTILKKQLIDILKITQFRQYPSLSEVEALVDECVNENDDKEIYEKLHQLVHQISKLKGRANNRVYNILQMITINDNDIKDNITSLLDVGCSEGSITASLGKTLNLPIEKIYGCDIEKLKEKDTNGFNFIHLTSDSKLPFENEKFSLVITLMSLHHMKKPEEMLKEIYRVLHPEGWFVIREHDQSEEDENFQVVLDVIHGLYSMVWKQEKEMEDFTKYFAKYRSQKEWIKLIKDAGFFEYELRHFENNPLRFFYGCFRKQPIPISITNKNKISNENEICLNTLS